jgi:hypothetical protein
LKYLVDAKVLSEPTKPEPYQPVADWLRSNEREIFVLVFQLRWKPEAL